MNMASNAKYVEAIAAKLRAAPLFIAKRAALYCFTRIVEAQVNNNFDSGQAAANWKIDGYDASPSYEPQQMMWGYLDVKPTAPVGYKTYFAGYDPVTNPSRGGENGDDLKVLSYQMTVAHEKLASLPANIGGITVYNPISPGFAGFEPADDTYYEENAFRSTGKILERIALESLAKAEAEASVILGDKNANFG